MKIVVVANCQANPIASLLGIACSKVEALRIPAIHTIKPDNANVLFDAVEQADVVVHQPIGENFGPLSSDKLREKYSDKHFISFPSIYFAGLLPHLGYLRKPGGGTLRGPLGDYHDLRILSAFLKGKSEAECLNGMDEIDLDFQAHYDSCMAESKRRETETDVRVMDAAESRMRDSHIFYTFNHIDNDLLWHVTLAVLDQLNLPHDKSPTPPQRLLLGGLISSVPRSLTNTLGCSWENPDHILEGTPLPMPELIANSYALYQETEKFDELLAYNTKRFTLPMAL